MHYLLNHQPAPEGADGTQVAVDRVAGEAVLLGTAIGVAGEAPLTLQVEDEGPYLQGGYLGYICGQSLGKEELLEVVDAAGDDVDVVLALALAFGAQAVTGGEVGQLGGGYGVNF